MTAATCRWNINTILLSGTPHICLHPSNCLHPPLHYPCSDFFSLSFPPSSESHLLKTSPGRSLVRRTLYFLLKLPWHFSQVYSSMSLFLCAHSLCRSTSFPLYRTIELYINMQTFTPNSAVCTYPSASRDNGRTCRGKAAHSSKPASHNNVRARHAGKGWKKNMCTPVK